MRLRVEQEALYVGGEACMKIILVSAAAISLLAGNGFAIETLSDRQLDAVTAGLELPDFQCDGCTLASSNSSSSNGSTPVTSHTIEIIGGGSVGGNPGGGNTGGGNTGGGNTGGGNTGGGSTGGGSNAPTSLDLINGRLNSIPPITTPANIVPILNLFSSARTVTP
jgi:hypothetical protein